jgi:hypothetical protein
MKMSAALDGIYEDIQSIAAAKLSRADIISRK